MTPAPGPVVVRIRFVSGLLVTGVLVAAVVVVVAVVFTVPVTRALQWGLLAVACVVAVGSLSLLAVPGRRWPDPPSAPVVAGWHGLKAVEETMRREELG